MIALPAAGLTPERLRDLLVPYLPAATVVPDHLFAHLATYLELLLRWNARTNLTAIRTPEEIVTRHFGESLFAGALLQDHLPQGAGLLDVGSGAGFPGLPIQLLRPDLEVTLVESQGKKAAFLREAVRTLRLTSDVFPARLETMAPGRRFSAATLRAVDQMSAATALARARVEEGGWLVLLGDGDREDPAAICIPIPGRSRSFVTLEQL